MTVIERLRAKANLLPLCAGVYIMKDFDGKIIYVGKSKKLKNRVGSYFSGTQKSLKTLKMVSLVRDFDYIVCDSEIEALALENTLIKKHSPKYNIKLKDAKSYPYVKVTREEYPKLLVTRERKGDKGGYYGPYSGVSGAYKALEAVQRIFSLPTCKRRFPQDIGKDRPCIYKDMGRCIAPCTGNISSSDYKLLVKRAEDVLDGKIKDTKALLVKEMYLASENMEFERAASLRDSVKALEQLTEKQKVIADKGVTRDVFALYTSETVGVLAIFSVRDGALANKNEFILSLGELTSPEDALSLIVDYYDTAGNIPKEIMLDFPLEEEDVSLLGEYLSLSASFRVRVKVPERGEGRRLCDMALENAKEAARRHGLLAEREDKNLARLAELLGLSDIPSRIEAYDISNIGDESITASMVVYSDGKMKKGDYRFFNIKTTSVRDDYASMREVLKRRLAHIGDATSSFTERPDVILVDGGKGHVGVAKEVVESFEYDIPVYGMVKDEYHKTRALTDSETEISIARELGVYSFVYNIQEEAHRFAVKNTMNAKRKTYKRSSLEKIEGIGPAKAEALLRAMPLSVIREASENELCAVKGISERDAKNVREYFLEKKKKAKGG